MCYPRLNNLPSIKRDFDAILNDWTVCDVGKYSSRTTVNRSPNKLSSNFISASVSKECEQLRYPCGLSWDIKIRNLFLIMLFQWSQVQISDYFNSSIRNATKHIFSFQLTWIVGIRRVYKQIATSERLTFTLIRKHVADRLAVLFCKVTDVWIKFNACMIKIISAIFLVTSLNVMLVTLGTHVTQCNEKRKLKIQMS